MYMQILTVCVCVCVLSKLCMWRQVKHIVDHQNLLIHDFNQAFHVEPTAYTVQ